MTTNAPRGKTTINTVTEPLRLNTYTTLVPFLLVTKTQSRYATSAHILQL